MKTLKLLALGSALLGVTQITQGGVLLGFNSFTSELDKSTPDDSKSGWSGSISSDVNYTGGSTDGYYGKDWNQPGIGHLIYTPADVLTNGNNGYVDVGDQAVFSGTAGTAGTIDALLFDAVSSGAETNFFVSWTFWQDSTKTGAPIAQNSSTSITLTANSPANGNYQDYAVNLGSFFLPAGGYFEVVWNWTSGQKSFNLDNIALVPEPGSMLGLGCLVGFGTLLRSRRRTGPAVIA